MSLPFAKNRMAVMAMAVLINTGLVALRFYVYRLTSSAAVLADALESVVNIFASGFALYAVWLAKRRDHDHPYGHPKIESMSAAVEGVLVIMAAGAILSHIWPVHQVADELRGALPLSGVAAGTLVLGVALLAAGKRLDSIAVRADGKHAFVDAVTSFGVAAALVVIRLTGWTWLDGATAFGLAAYIVFEGWGLLRRAVPRLVAEGR